MIFSSDQVSALMRFVSDINLEQVNRSTALYRLEQLRDVVPQASLDLAWDVENIGGYAIYCLLASVNNEIYSISSSKRSFVPWPLRGALNVDSDVLLTVNSHSLTVANVVFFLDFIWKHKDISTQIIDMALLAKECEKNPIDVTEEELAGAVRRFLQGKGLRDVEAADQWLLSNGLSRARLEDKLHELIVKEKVGRMLVDDEFEEQFRHHRNAYQGLRVAQLAVPDDDVLMVQGILQQYDGKDIFDIASEIAWKGGYRHPLNIEFVELLRYEIAAESANIFEQPMGTVLLARMWHGDARLIKIMGCESDISDEALERRVVKRLVHKWCTEQRRYAQIEWRWGKADAAGTTFS